MTDRPPAPELAARTALPTVTLVAVTSVAVPATVRALTASMRQADFGAVLLLSDQPPTVDTDSLIQWRRIEPLGSRAAYSRFMLRELSGHIETPHALCVQWDGFVIDGRAWDRDFLSYDYIGAPWPHFRDGHNVGNGGFSLRSRELLQACRELPSDGSDAEDLLISRQYRPWLEDRGIRFAPEAVARRFAYERMPSNGREFGFHGVFNLVRHLSRADASRILGQLEPGMLARGERLEMLRWALLRGEIGVAFSMLKRLA